MDVDLSRLMQLDSRIEAAVRVGLQRGVELIGTASDEKVPVDTGELKASKLTAVSGLEAGVGYSDTKAVAAHEDMHHRFRGGKESKFLETAMHEKASEAADAVADAVRRALT